ncbi:non-homologous end joining protein Ku [Plastoroseomonas hellenica]|uniref:non-homologous end joining protein Ku n=1 Tax=Plastoroseomonas hellenica TaxID=2687306 RepID=UPI001BAA1875|nr:Ku protein [Plastoroseomonas hellenica]MBR0641365.1 Ku protein [Plastoroseomonas hellenica]
MAPKPFWKGYLKLSLVTCPVAMTPATTDSEKVRFHTLNRETGNRVVSQYVDAESGKPVDDDDEVRGYQHGEDEFVLLEDDELAAVALESTRTIDIETFVPSDSVEWIWYDKPHYLTPDDPVGEEAFCVIRDAMEASKTVGISRLVMYRRERPVLLEPRDRGIVLWTLRYGDEVRDPEPYFGGIGDEQPDTTLKKMVATLIEERTEAWHPSMVRDPVQERLLEIIASKKKGRPRPAAKPRTEEPSGGNVVSIMDALRKSLSQEGKAKRR